MLTLFFWGKKSSEKVLFLRITSRYNIYNEWYIYYVYYVKIY